MKLPRPIDSKSKYVAKIKFDKVDEHGNVPLFHFFSKCQERLVEHGEVLDVGVNFTKETGQVFILCREKAYFYHKFEVGKEYTFVTYPSWANRIQAYRVIYIIDENDECMMALNSLWVLMNLNSRRITTTDMMKERFIKQGILEEVENNDTIFQDKLLQLEDVDISNCKAKTFKVSKDQIDDNRHLNNTFYSQFVDECKLDGVIKSIEINFEKECYLDEEIDVYKVVKENENYFIGYKKDGNISFKYKVNY